jgi:hypothetical protein
MLSANVINAIILGMIVLLHVLVALSSVCYTTYLFFRPTKKNFYISYCLIGMTFATGIYLVWSTHSPLLRSCIAGLVYLAVVSFGIGVAQRRATVYNRNE